MTNEELLQKIEELERQVNMLKISPLSTQGDRSILTGDVTFQGQAALRLPIIYALSSGTNPTDPEANGVFLNALGETFDGTTYHLGGVNKGTLQFGLNSSNGTATFYGGKARMDNNGLSLDGIAYGAKILGSESGNSRGMYLRLVSPTITTIPGGRSVPAGALEYSVPTATNLLTNSYFTTDASAWEGLQLNSSGVSGNCGQFMGVLSETTTNGNVYAVAIDANWNIYAGGSFTSINGVSANRIAKYTKSTGVWSELGTGLGGDCLTIAIDTTGVVYAGGSFTTAGGGGANRIASWNGAAWSALGTGLGAACNAIAIDQNTNYVYAGGDFTTAAGATANHIAMWNGAAWSALVDTATNGVNGNVYALLYDGATEDRLYIGGAFTTAGPDVCNYFARWDRGGNNFDALGNFDNNVYAIARDSNNNYLYIGGAFTTLTTLAPHACNKVACIDISAPGGDYYHGNLDNGFTTWNGATDVISALAYDDSNDVLYAGGIFSQSGSVAAINIAAWSPSSGWNGIGDASARVHCLATVGPTQNVVGNVVIGGQFDTVDGYSSSRIAVRCNSVWTDGGAGTSGDRVALTAGDNAPYVVSGYLKNRRGLYIEVYIGYYDSNDNWISYEDILTTDTASDNWIYFNHEVSVPGNATYIQVFFYPYGNYVIADAYVDSVTFTETLGVKNSIYFHPYPMLYDGTATPPTRIIGAKSQLYAPLAPVIALVVTGSGNCTNGAHLCKTTFVDQYGETETSAESNSVTVDGTHKQITCPLEIGPWGTTSRNIYMTEAGGSTYKLVGTQADNTTTSYTINVSDANLTTVAPVVNDSGSRFLIQDNFILPATSMTFKATTTLSTGLWIEVYTLPADANSGDWVSGYIYCLGGTYTIFIIGLKNGNMGIYDLYIDNVLVASGYDFYNGSSVQAYWTTTNIAISGDGVHKVLLLNNGKNASSSDYGLSLYYISGNRTGD